jgi:hypothetical protein
MVREGPETSSHLVNAGFDSRAKRLRKFEKRSVETAVVDLEGAHAALTFTCPGTHSLRFFILGLFQGGFKFGRELKFIFQKVIEQSAELPELSSRKLVQLGLDLFDLAHASR